MIEKLTKQTNFLDYLRALKECLPHYVVFIAVNDTGAAQYFTAEHATAMAELGLKVNMTNRYRQPYIAIIDKGRVAKEIVSAKLDEPLTVSCKLGKHNVLVYSAGFGCQKGAGMDAMVMIDGADYMRGGRGFNFLIFDADNDEILDNRSFDMYDEGRCNNQMSGISLPLTSFVKNWGGYSYVHWIYHERRLNILLMLVLMKIGCKKFK